MPIAQDENEAKGSKDQHITPVSMEDWKARLRARLLYGRPSQKALVCEGEAGCGKSEITKQTCEEMGLKPVICPGIGAQQMEEFLALVKIVDGGDGQAKILQAVHENLLPTEAMVKDPKYTVSVKGKPKVIIPWIIDEIWTGNMGQMNQIRGFLTFRQSGSVRIPDQTFIIGTTNPEDVVYSSRRSVDAAVMERVETVRVFMEFDMHQRYLARLEQLGEYPSICRLFLKMKEQRDLWHLASPRFWHICFGDTWHELSSDEKMPLDQRLRLFEQTLSDHFQQIALKNKQRRSKEKLPLTPQALIGRFQNFIEHGDDPHYYPISSINILHDADDKEAAKEHIGLFKWWKANNLHNFIGVTIQDLQMAVLDDAICPSLSKPQARHIAALIELCGSDAASAFFKQVYNERKNTPMYDTLYAEISKMDSFKDIANAMLQYSKVKKQLMRSELGLKGSSEDAG